MIALPYFAPDPVLFSLGPVHIKWYGLSYVMGIFCGWAYAHYLVKRKIFPFSALLIDEFVPWVTIGIVAGGRLGEVLFYNPSYYISHPLEIFYLWQPGMSFHGGLLGVCIATLWFCRRHRISIVYFLDFVSVCVPFGLFFGRLANYINGELVGRITDVPWAIIFPHAGPHPRHPSQLYEALLEGVLLFLILNFFTRRVRWVHQTPGTLSGLFSLCYGVMRCFVEVFREPDTHIGYMIGGTTWGQWLSVPLILFGLILIGRGWKNSNATTP